MLKLKNIFSFLILGTAFLNAHGQSDGCSSATPIAITANCSSPTNGTTTGATQTIVGCTGTADDDVWYSFVATATAHRIEVTGAAGMDPVVQLFSGGCGTLVSLVCRDDSFSGETETINYSSLTIGQTYYIRVYHYFAGSGTGNFTICVTNPPPAPSNDACGGATALTVNSTCVYTAGSTDGATQSGTGCAGTADDDVWYSFIASNAVQNISVDPLDIMDPVVQVFSGSCGSLTSIRCVDNTLSGENEDFQIVGLIPGQTYYIKVFDYYTGYTGDFNICVNGELTPAPSNDEPCNAIQMPPVTATCTYSEFTNVGATASMGAPTPFSCIGGSGAAQGGFNPGTADVWFAITVPSSGNVYISSQPNSSGGYISDGVMALYSEGTDCNDLTQIVCSDDHNYPTGTYDLLPLISATGLTPGETVYLRYWGYSSAQGNFGFCVTTATNDDCENALYICDINGYSASTSAAYTVDMPDGMRGNNQDSFGNNLADGVNSGGLFGAGGPWGTGSAAIDVVIDNNSWIRFTASATTATLSVNVYDCFINAGIQMQIFEGTNCSNWTPVSNFEESATGFTITATGLTVGNDYYLMVDGFAGDICNYTITAESGVQFPDIPDVTPICSGETVDLTAPDGATSYEWQHNGSSSQTVSVAPGTTQTYYCEVTGLCDYKQTLEVDVVVKPDPDVQIVQGTTVDICQGESVALTASGATSYLWSNSQTLTTINVSPSSSTAYSVTGTLDGCTNDATINVNVNNPPTLSVTPSITESDCGAATGSITGAVASGAPTLTYLWENGSGTDMGTTANLTSIPAGVYYLTVTDGNTCDATFGPYNVTNPGAPAAPTIIVDDATPCFGGDFELIAMHADGSATFDWSGPSSFSSTSSTINFTNITNVQQGNYCVTATVAGCTGPATCEPITVLALPLVDVTAGGNDSTICENDAFDLTASGATTYNWTGPNSFSSSSPSISVTDMSSANEGYYVVTGVDANGCSNEDSIEITMLNLPVIGLSADIATAIYCDGGIASLSATGADSYNWTGPAGYSDIGTNTTIVDIDASNQGWYYVEAIDLNNCRNNDSLYVTVITDVSANASGDSVLCPGEDANFFATGGTSYIWTGPMGLYTENASFSIIGAEYENSGWYYLTTVDENNCLGYDSTYLSVEANGLCLEIPNLITPDEDGKNDKWVINGIEQYPISEVEIYNRWGNLIYSASPYLNDWNGEVNNGQGIGGNKVPVGTYFYILRLNVEGIDPFKGYIEVQY